MSTGAPRLLVLDSAFSFQAIRERGLEDSVTCRDLEGFFKHVWSVHPFGSLVSSEETTARYGPPDWHALSASHTFIEGKVGRYRILRRVPAINFLVAQCGVLLTLARLVRRERIDVIRAGDPLYLGLLGWLLSRLCGVPLVLRVGANYDKIHETTRRPMLPRLFLSRRVEKWVERFVFPRADLVAGANQDNLEFALANGASRERSTLFRYGNLIDRRHFVPPSQRAGGEALLEELNVEEGKFLLYVGRLESVKHPDDVVRVLADLRGRGHDLKAVLVGDGSMRGAVSELARLLGLEEFVLLCGNRSQSWLAQVMPLAALVVSPHTGRALSEAALAAVPIVAYDVDWQSEVVQSGATGELVPFGDSAAMAEAADRLLSDRDYARRAGHDVRQRVLELMDPERLNEHERQEYAALLRRPNAAVDMPEKQRVKTAVIYYPGFLHRAGGAFFHARNLETALRALGWKASVVTMDDLPIWCRYLPHSVQVLVNYFCTPFGFLWKEKLIKALYRLFLDRRSDVRVFEDVYIAWESEIPTLIVLHAVWSDNLQSHTVDPERVRRLKDWEARIINRLAPPLVTVSFPYRRFLEQAHFEGRLSKRLGVIELGRDTAPFRGPASNARDPKSIVYVGALEARKNVFFMLDVMRRLHELDPSYRLTIVGNGPEEQALEAYSATHALPVVFTGRMTFEQVVSELYRHSIYIHTSVKESFSYALLEAKLAGLRTCAYAGLQVPEQFIDIPVPRFEIEAWCEAILQPPRKTGTFDGERYRSERMARETLEMLGAA